MRPGSRRRQEKNEIEGFDLIRSFTAAWDAVTSAVTTDNSGIWQGWAGIFQAVFAAALVWVGAGTIRIYRRMHNIMAEQNAIAKRQADIADEQMAQAVRALVLVRTEKVELDNAVEDLVSTHRKGLRPLAVPPSVGFWLRNHGRGAAILQLIQAKFVATEEPPAEDTAYVSRDLPREHVLSPGQETERLCASLPASYRIDEDEFARLMHENCFWWLCGMIWYQDERGHTFVYHFCWRYNVSLREFSPWPRERNYTQPYDVPARPAPRTEHPWGRAHPTARSM